jgi:hypothetical protein
MRSHAATMAPVVIGESCRGGSLLLVELTKAARQQAAFGQRARLAPEAPRVEKVTVQRTLQVGGQGPLETYRCPVDSNGFYGCSLVVFP